MTTEKLENPGLEVALEKLNLEKGILGITYSAEDSPGTLEKKFLDAVSSDDVKSMKGIIELGKININCTNPKTLQTALHISCARSHLDAVQFLLNQDGVEVDVKDNYGNKAVDLLAPGQNSAKIRALVEAKSSVEEEEDLVKKEGAITPVSDIPGNYKYHVFICHDYKDHKRAKDVKTALEELGIVVSMTASMMANAAEVKKLVGQSKLVLILSSKTFLSKLQDPAKFARSGCVIEMDSFINDKDISDVLVGAVDVYSKSVEKWAECPGYDNVVEEGVIYDLSNAKGLNISLPSLYRQIKIRVL